MSGDLGKYLEQIDKCSHCEFCQATCPSFREELVETLLARSRLLLIKACLIDRELTPSPRFRDIVDGCLMCGRCVEACPARIPVDEVVAAARGELNKGKFCHELRRRALTRFMANRGPDRMIAFAFAIAEKMGLWPPGIPQPVSAPVTGKLSGVVKSRGQERGRVVYYIGCAANSLDPVTARDVVQVFTENGIEVMVPPDLVCCGLPALAEGDLEEARGAVVRNLEILGGLDAEAIITDCSSCGMMLKVKSLSLIPAGHPLRATAEAVSGKVWEATEYLNGVGLSRKPGGLEVVYTYHEPCHRSFSPTMKDAPRALLASLPGSRFSELADPGQCCGAGGTFFLEHRDLSGRIRAKKLEDIKSTGAEVVISQCPACRAYLAAALPGKELLHPLSLLARAYGFRGGG